MNKDIRFETPTFIDPLTGLFNRYYLDQFLPEELKKASLSNYPLAILMIDLDGFKKINDNYGHLCGDKILTQVSAIIKNAVRQTDMVIRYAGDEFIILLPGSGREKTQGICSSLVKEIEKNVFIGDKNQEFHLTLSVGFSMYPEDTQEQVKLINMADRALYLAKKRGRNTYSSAKEVTTEEVSFLVAMDSFPCPEFINQEQELNRLKQIFERVMESNLLQAVFISGISGVGKSRVIREIRAYFKDQCSLLYGNSTLAHSQDPYHLFTQGIGAYIEAVGIDSPLTAGVLSKLPLPELSELSLMIPQFRNLVKKPLDSGAYDQKKRFLLFKAFVDFLINLSKSSCVLMIFDDTQWADKASLELLRYLLKQENKMKVFIVCAYLADEAPEKNVSDNFRSFLKEIAGSDNLTEIKLANLSLRDTSKMINAIFPGIGTQDKFSHLIYDTTKGNPSFVEELLKSLVEKGIIFYQNNSWQVKEDIAPKDIPASLQEIVKERLKNLDDETKQMILQAAVMGDDFQVDVLKNIGDKNEGFISELVNRAQKMRLIDELGTGGKFNFINKDTQNILYNQLDAEQRNQIHYDIAQVLADTHRDSLYNVAGEIAFHFSQAPQQEKAIELSKELLKKTSEIFDPREIVGYLEQLAKELLAKEEKIIVDLNEKMMQEAIKFIIFLQGAVKKFRLYPVSSSVRLNTVKEIHSSLNKILQEAPCLVISEVEKSLVINGKRLSPSEVEYAHAEDLLSIMMEHNIKTISFKAGLEEGELNSFIHCLSQTRKDIMEKGGWTGVISQEGLGHIGIDEVRFTSVDEYTTKSKERAKLQDAMLMEFLMGKIDPSATNREELISDIEKNPKKIVQTIMDMVNMITEKDKTQDKVKVISDVITKINSQILNKEPSGRSRADDLVKVILELEPKLRNRVIHHFSSETGIEQKKVMNDIMNTVSDDFIIDMIIEEYKNNIDNPLMVKEFINDVLKKEWKKKVLTKLEPKLLELNSNKQDIAFVVEKIEWEDVPIDRRVEMLLSLPKENYSVSVLDKISNILEELDSPGKKEELKNLIVSLLTKIEQAEGKVGKDLLGIIIDFIKKPFINKEEGGLQIPNRASCILERLDLETNVAIFVHLLEICKEIIDGFMSTSPESRNIILGVEKAIGRRYYLFIDELFYLLQKRLKMEGDKNSGISRLIWNFVLDISTTPFIEILACRIIDDSAKNKYDILNIYSIIGDEFIDTLIELAAGKSINLKDPFREFLLKRKIANLLIDLKDASMSRLKKVLSDRKEEVIAPIIELIGYLKNAEFVDLLLPFIQHKDLVIRITTIVALGEIGSEKCVEVLTKLAKDGGDENIRDLANVRLQRLKKKVQS